MDYARGAEARDVVSANIRGGICDGIFEHPGYPQITQQGNAIRLLEYGHHWDDMDLCIYDVGTLVEPIGAFPPGNYTLTVDFIYPDVVGPTAVTLGTIPFVVTGVAQARPVAVSTPSGRLALVSLIFGAAILTLRRQRRSTR